MGQSELQIFTEKRPVELTEVFENISGSSAYKEKYEELKKSIMLTNSNIIEKNEVMRNLKRDRRNCKTMLSSCQKAEEYANELKAQEETVFRIKELQHHLLMNQEKKTKESAEKDTGGSIATKESNCRTWFCTISRTTPTPS